MKKNKTTSNFDSEFDNQGIIDFAPTRKKSRKEKASRKITLMGICLALVAASGFIATTITFGLTHASAHPVFTTANAIAAKQDSEVGSIAAIAVLIIAASALATFSNKKKA